jgi:hypothetical protein
MARGRHDYEKKVISVESEGYRDLHGRILMQDDFETSPLKWDTAGTGTWFVDRQTRAAYNGSYGLELDVTAVAPPITNHATAYRYIPIDVTERLLTELFWRVNDLTDLFTLHLQMYYYDGVNRVEASIIYNPGTQIWTYINDIGGTVQLQGSNQNLHDNAWNELTISADFSTNEYIVFKSNNVEINMGGIAMQSILSGLGAHVRIWLGAYSRTGNQLIVSIDDTVVRELEN